MKLPPEKAMERLQNGIWYKAGNARVACFYIDGRSACGKYASLYARLDGQVGLDDEHMPRRGRCAMCEKRVQYWRERALGKKVRG